ncbi:MAG: FeoB-associated Cys-rich membrane protein [Bacteroidales bacterium]|nr:FeoB-associated Cys-rich membrane protein [Bacteroidales bacterium]
MQEIIVFIMVVASVAYTISGFIKFFLKKSQNTCACSSGCNLKSNVAEFKSLPHRNLL